MSKVLVDRELLERVEQWVQEDCTALEELQAVLAQPAEAEGVDFGFDDRSVRVSQEAYSIFLARERHNRAALSAVTAERDRLAAENEQLKHVPAQELLERLVAQLKESGAENYQESCFGLQIGSKELEAFVTLRHAGKPGPHQLRMAAEAERDQLRVEVEALRPHITELLEFIFDRFGSVQHAAELTDQAVAAVRALEPFAAMAAKEA